MEALIVLLVLAFPVGIVVALAVAIGARSRLTLVEQRLNAIESRLGVAGPPTTFGPSPAPAAPPEPQIYTPPAMVTPPAATTPPEPIAPPSFEAPPAAEPPPPAEPPAPPPQPPMPPPPGPSLEEQFGTRWVVWAGGIALALGGIFLVRYTIEQGLLGPGARVFLGALLAVALIVAGEWARRSEKLAGLAVLPTSHIPSILTAAGTTVAYATVYAAYALYGFLAPGAAFLLLGVVALATLAAALLHGPALAGLGLVGGYVTPLLVSTAAPNFWALYIYLAVVTAAAFALARIRLWRWLAFTAIVFGFMWMLPGLDAWYADWIAPHAFHAVAGFALVAVVIVSGFMYGPQAEPDRIDAVSSIGLAAYLFAAALLVIASHHDGLALAAFTVLVVATVAIAWRAQAATGAVPAAAVLAALVIADWAVDLQLEHLVAPATRAREPLPEAIGLHLAVGAGLAALFGASGFLAQGRSERPEPPMLWAASAVFAPLAILVALYYRIAHFEQSIPFAGIALVLAALFAYATEALAKREPRPGMVFATALFAIGTIASLALALTFALEKGWLTIALALMVPGIAYVGEKRPLPMLRWLAAIVGLIVLARIGWEPRIVGSRVGTTPIFNWLLYGYGVPALSFWIAGHLLRKNADDVPTRTVESLAILFTLLLAFLEIRHLIYYGDVYREASGLAEVALQVSVWLAMAIGLEHVRARTKSVVHDVGAVVIAALALLGIVFGLWLRENPLFTGDPVGGPFVNFILLGYGLPALLAITLALTARNTRPMAYRAIAATAAVALALSYLSLEVRTLYHGPVLDEGATTDAEQYTYSAVWLAYGVVLLIAGVFLRSQPTRFASAAVVILTVAKVFLYDMAGLQGVYKSLSLLGLGVVLVGIGLLYQRVLFPHRRPAPPPAPDPAPSGAANA